jgi:hypothetical protein
MKPKHDLAGKRELAVLCIVAACSVNMSGSFSNADLVRLWWRSQMEKSILMPIGHEG